MKIRGFDEQATSPLATLGSAGNGSTCKTLVGSDARRSVESSRISSRPLYPITASLVRLEDDGSGIERNPATVGQHPPRHEPEEERSVDHRLVIELLLLRQPGRRRILRGRAN